MRTAAAFVACLLAVTTARAETVQATMDNWYAALQRADRQDLDALLAPEATISITDLDIIQNRSEFLDSLDEWQDAIAGGTIRHRVEAFNAANATVLVCYTFPNNAALVRETFTFAGLLVSTYAQTAVAEDCSAF